MTMIHQMRVLKTICFLAWIIIFCCIPNSKVWAQEEIFTAVAWSPDGQTLAIGGSNGTEGIILVQGILENSVKRNTIAGEVTRTSWSPDGLRLAVRFNPEGVGSKIVIWDAELSKILITTEQFGISGFYSLLEWSPDGKHIAVDTGASVDIFDTSTGALTVTLYDNSRFGNAGPVQFEWGLDSQSIYVLYDISVKEEVVVWDVGTATVIQAFDIAEQAVNFALRTRLKTSP